MKIKELNKYLTPIIRANLSAAAVHYLMGKLNRAELMHATDYSICLERLRGWGLGVGTYIGTGPKVNVKRRKRA